MTRHSRSLGFPVVALGAFVCAVSSPACGGVDQWEVVLSTNASIPRMGDRVQVDVLDESGKLACPDCTRELQADGDEFGAKSFGVAKTESAVRVRVRLFRYASRVKQTNARIIDVVARLPKLGGSEPIMSVEFPIPVECLGVAPDVAQHTTCRRDESGGASFGPEPTLGAAGRLAPTPSGECEKAIPNGMTCIGHGTFVMGDERIDALAFDFPSRPESVQRIAPGAALVLDTDEVSVGEVRALVKENKLDPALVARGLLAEGGSDSREGACTWRSVDFGFFDDKPINCVSRELARAVCAAKGMRLPYEHEWEFAAGNASQETLYPWGNGQFEDQLYDVARGQGIVDGICDFAWVGNGRIAFGESPDCKRTAPPGPKAGGSALDVTTQGLKNMGGNVAEWVEDEFALYDDECWSKPLAAPCRTPSKKLGGSRAPYRGGSWASSAHATFAVARFAEPDGAPSPAIGFRCATTEAELP